MTNNKSTNRLPAWIKKDLRHTKDVMQLKKSITGKNLHTVCEEAKCPNLSECFKNKTATFMILGNICTRDCAFCSIESGKPLNKDITNQSEADEIIKMVKELSLKHLVITSVTRDDLVNGGAEQFAKIIRMVKSETPNTTIEVLTPDFKGLDRARKIVSIARPDIYNHNIETVKELYSTVRPEATYLRSLEFLKKIKTDDDSSILTKTGIMVGLGETMDQLKFMLEDVKKTNVDIFTCGQYLRPTKFNHKVIEYKEEEWFEMFKTMAEIEFGIKYVYSSPFMRSSYNAGELLERIKSGK